MSKLGRADLAKENGSTFKKARELQSALDESTWVPSESDEACVQLLMESINLSLAAENLLNEAYPLPAEILLRSLQDRVSTVQHLALEGERGFSDWKSKKLPSLASRVAKVLDLTEAEFESTLKPHIKLLHKSTHGDFHRKSVNQGNDGGILKYWLGSNPTFPDQLENISSLFEYWHNPIRHFIQGLIDRARNHPPKNN